MAMTLLTHGPGAAPLTTAELREALSLIHTGVDSLEKAMTIGDADAFHGIAGRTASILELLARVEVPTPASRLTVLG